MHIATVSHTKYSRAVAMEWPLRAIYGMQVFRSFKMPYKCDEAMCCTDITTTRIYIHIYTYTYIHAYIHTHIHSHTLTHTHTHTHIRIHTHAHTHTHTHTYIHTYIHTHTRTYTHTYSVHMSPTKNRLDYLREDGISNYSPPT